MTTEFETVAQRVALALRRHGVDVIFGQSLPSAVILAAEALGIRQISYRQENMGGAMADGYARMSGRVAVVAAQNGPAATLLVPPLAEALKASIPIVALVQEVERDQADRNAFQELDHIALFQSCSKFVRRVVTADRIDDYIDMAFTAAASGRPGPAALLLPADLLRQAAAVPLVRRSANLGFWPLDNVRPSDDEIIDLAQRIARAEAPVVIAGGGVHAADGPHALAHLQDLASLPVFTTNMGKGAVDEFHPLSAGPMTLMGPLSLGARTRQLLDEADLIVMVATRSNQNGTDSWRLIPPTATIVHIDIDPVEIGRNYEAIRLVGSASETLKSLCIALKNVDLSTRRKKRRGLEAAIADAWSAFARDRLSLMEQNGRPLRPEAVMKELQERMTAQTIVVADASYSSMWIVGQLRSLRAGMRFLAPRGLAGLGWGLPLALGAKAARPGQHVIAVVGDGGFAHSWAELETLVRSRLPVTILLLNNGILGFQKHAETVKFGEYTSAIHFHDVDHVKIAEACGCPAVRSHSIADVSAALDRAFETDGPLLVEIMTDPDAFPALSLFAGLEVAA
ncbi:MULTISPECIES: acetolactate synthase catalytic subunit [unclassified Neorhizobium]|uniref:acetolactate synthase catalytic subunit n=1 Tax=unclassified Neorhizobium TaxID=2629175 RepID=UPI001FF0E424|nr:MULTISPECIES: acetolactate synthase catalytic subunit [unclassified Neorhizobium]MCJ9671566.1 acetolactate synthase catalytic subunit [Neorhizobium sp. SHOUNA12B]MCJ9745878.1 acetolactate synthase catalytic subunit [Neorhizobium sp. SHOUNA12A]